MSLAIHLIDNVGRWFLGSLHYTVKVLTMIYVSFRATVTDEAQGFRSIVQVVSAQIYFTGVQALPLVSVLALAAGGVVILQSTFQMSLLGGGDLVGNLMVMIIVREIAPLLTALVVIARSGTAVASEIGSMRVNREIEALESMGINPLSYIIFPRLVGGVLSVVGLSIYFVFVATIGGFLLTRFMQEMTLGFYLNSLAHAFSGGDVFLFFLKIFFSGFIIFVVCSYQGLLVKQSPHEVPQVTTKAVVNSIIYVTVFNMTVTALFYLSQLMKMGVI